ncbi:MAG: hypothetical protein Q7O66_14780, partial [Dehalococcoidia bacterium]|nr:hypothetical protein [Dehalococcoidia bacterium]
IASAASYKPNLTVHTQAMDRKSMQRLKDAGLDSLSVQTEAWEPHIFKAVCPGKAKHASYEAWLEAAQEAVDVFGAGNVGQKIIAGLSMMPENGHKTWQESLASHIEGNSWMIKNGIIPNFTNLRLPPGSVYAADQSLREKLPPTEYYLDLMKAHDEDMLEHGLYEKINRLFKCGLDCASGPYSCEIGMLSVAGDVGTWMGSVVPYEFNWLAQFLDSIKSTAKTE